MTTTAAAVQSHPTDTLLDRVITIKAQIKLLEAELQGAIDSLSDLVQSGDIDPSFSHEDWSFSFNTGRTTTVYSQKANASIKAIQEADIALGLSTAKIGDAFWTIKAPTF
jgi:hypothetical protein